MQNRTYIEEIESALERDDNRLGEVFRARRQDGDRDAKSIAEEFGLSTPGTIYTNLRAIETIIDCRVRRPIGPTSAVQIARMVRSFSHAAQVDPLRRDQGAAVRLGGRTRPYCERWGSDYPGNRGDRK